MVNLGGGYHDNILGGNYIGFWSGERVTAQRIQPNADVALRCIITRDVTVICVTAKINPSLV